MGLPANRLTADGSYTTNSRVRWVGVSLAPALPGNTAKGMRMNFLIVFLGGGIGCALRHGVNVLALRTVGIAFPFGTLFINIVGSLAMGLLVEYFALRSSISMSSRLFFTTGLIGGFTTFSTFALETALLHERGDLGLAAVYVMASVSLSIGALFAGMALVRSLTG